MNGDRQRAGKPDLTDYDRSGLTGWEVAFGVSVLAAFVGLVLKYAG